MTTETKITMGNTTHTPWKQWIFSTQNGWAGTIMRITLGLVLWPHGAQKVLGWFGGYGFLDTMNYFTETMNLPGVIAFSVIVIEFFGSLSLIAGWVTRFWALAIIGLMFGIILTSHLEYGFFMNWNGNQAGEGFEYHLLVIGLSLAILVHGSGKYAIDSNIQLK